MPIIFKGMLLAVGFIFGIIVLFIAFTVIFGIVVSIGDFINSRRSK